jgi:lipoprotein-anchoring transpeptidase ErfK/SrfK
MPSRRRAFAPLLAALALALTAAAPAVAQDPGTTPPPPPAPQPAPEPTIKPGVTAAGIDLSGLTVTQATQKLDAELRPKLEAPFVLDSAGRRWVLSAKASMLTFDSARTARRALAVATAPAQVPVALTHSRAAVRAFVAEVAKRVTSEPRDATVAITLYRVKLRDGRPGKTLPSATIAPAINAALDEETGAQRELRQRLTTVRPKVTNAIARRQYGTVITVDKSHFRLRLFKRFRVVKTYGVAVGQPAYPTPSGLFSVVNKQVNPTWSVPNSPWAGELAGTTVQGGSAANPLKARWMGIVNGVGIHGTGEDSSIGSRASHGCIRMHVSDVIDLYPRVPVGTPVLLK